MAAELSFFLVFWPDELTLIILCAIAITIVNVVAKRTTVKSEFGTSVNHQTSSLHYYAFSLQCSLEKNGQKQWERIFDSSISDSLCAFLLSLSRFVIFPVALTFLFIIYSAAFRGNMVIPYVSPVVWVSSLWYTKAPNRCWLLLK